MQTQEAGRVNKNQAKFFKYLYLFLFIRTLGDRVSREDKKYTLSNKTGIDRKDTQTWHKGTMT